MKIIKITDTVKLICADEGKIVTNGKDYGLRISTGINVSDDNFHEITEEEYNHIMEANEPDITQRG